MKVSMEILKLENKTRVLIYRLVIVAVLSSIFTFLISRQFFLTKTVTLEMTIQQDFNGVIQMFHQGKKDNGVMDFTEENSVIYPGLKVGIPNKVKINIPYYFPQILRMDFNHNAPGIVRITGLKLSGVNILTQKEIDFCRMSDCSIQKKTPESLELVNGAKDPFILLDTRTLLPVKHLDFYAAGTVFALSFLFLMLFIRWISVLHTAEKLRYADYIFIFAFLLLLLIPAAKINRGKISKTENRTLAKFPVFFDLKENQINSQFGSGFEKYFNDRFFGRDRVIFPYRKLISFSNMIKRKYVGRYVIEGKDDWYFYRLEGSVDNFANRYVLSEKTMKKWLDKLVYFNSWCEKNGIRFYYYIAPDKNRVYGEYFTFATKVRPDSESKIARWVDYIRKNSNLKVIYPLEELNRRKSEGLLYYKNNTHWNHLGAYYGYRVLAETIKKDFPALPLFEAENSWKEENHFCGDLYAMAPEAVKQDPEKYKVPAKMYKHLCQRGHVDEEFRNHKGKHTVLLLKDSFGATLLDYMFPTFRRIYSQHKYYISEAEISILSRPETKPDMIIFEHVGRNLPRVENFLQSTDLLTEKQR